MCKIPINCAEIFKCAKPKCNESSKISFICVGYADNNLDSYQCGYVNESVGILKKLDFSKENLHFFMDNLILIDFSEPMLMQEFEKQNCEVRNN